MAFTSICPNGGEMRAFKAAEGQQICQRFAFDLMLTSTDRVPGFGVEQINIRHVSHSHDDMLWHALEMFAGHINIRGVMTKPREPYRVPFG